MVNLSLDTNAKVPLSYNYTVRFIGYDSIQTRRFIILSLSNSHNNVASIQKNRGDKSQRVIVAFRQEPGLASTRLRGQPFYGQPAINIYMIAGANLGQPFLPVTLLETWVDPPRRVRIPVRFMEFLHVKVG